MLQTNIKGGDVYNRIATILRIGFFAIICGYIGQFCYFFTITAAAEIPIGPAYQGPKAVIAVGDFAVQAKGAPQEIGDGLREMLQTALFESNYFIVVDRMDTAGISAEQLLSDSFLSNPDAILKQGQMDPAEILIYGTVISLVGGGAGLRVKIPWLPLKLGGKYHQATVTLELRIVDSASGRVVAALFIDGTAVSGKGMVGTSIGNLDIPVELEVFQNTPLELAIRDCIYRAVVKLTQTIPKDLFRHQGS